MALRSTITTLTAALLANSACAVDIAFLDGKECTGTGLYGTQSIPQLPCFDLSTLDPASSVHMYNITQGQVLNFFSDNACQEALHTTADIESECFTPSSGHMGSFSVHGAEASAEHKRDANTSDIAPYAVKMSDLTAMGPYDVKSVQLGLSIFTLGVSGLAAYSGLTLYSAINTCTALKDNDNPTAQDKFNCAASPLATVIGWVTAYLFHKAGQRTNGRIDLALGNINTAKRSVDAIDEINADAVHAMMKRSAAGGPSFVGFVERNMSTGTHTSPLYEISTGKGRSAHITSFYDRDSDDFVFHMRDAAETAIDKRNAPTPYNSIRWGVGGYDFRYCPQNTHASTGGFEGKSLEYVYDVAYDQLACYDVTKDLGDQQGVGVDMYNTDQVIVGELTIVPYVSVHHAVPGCNVNAYTYDQTCAVA